ncbi:hypothetical protein [Enterococcus rivorum]|uniref:hypothetical protein n=1 Tax=Enterococcus rivorum TaxID=762845 RepID=UPI003631578F
MIPWDSNFEKHLSVIGASQNEVENTLKLFIQKIAETDNENIRHFVHIVDTNKNNYDYLGNEDVVVSYLSDEESMKNVLEGVLNEQRAIQEQNIDVSMNHYFMIVNIADFGEKIAKDLIPVCKELYEDFPMIKFITFGSPTEYGSKYDEFSKLVKQNKHGLLFMKYSDQSILTASNLNFKSPKLMNQEAYYVINDLAYQVKIPLV